MKHQGKAASAGLRLISLGLFVVLVITGAAMAFLAPSALTKLAVALGALWVLFTIFSLSFFRDPTPATPAGPGLLVAPGHGKVDWIDEMEEPEVMGGPCRRISIFLSVFDVHIQQAPLAGKVVFIRRRAGKFLNAIRPDCAAVNENVLIGFESAEHPTRRVGVRLITGLIARRIIPWLSLNEMVTRGERISLIQFGSRVDLYLPLDAELKVKVGDRVVGGETVMASWKVQ